MQLEPELRKSLRARGHSLKPVVMLGERGLAESVVAELEIVLETHELVKVRLPATDRDARTQLAAELLEVTGATQVQSIGRIVLIYRKRKVKAAETHVDRGRTGNVAAAKHGPNKKPPRRTPPR